MHRNKLLKIAIPLLSILLLNSVYFGISGFVGRQVQQYPEWDFPRLQTLYMVEAWPAATARTMALECKIDVFLGATTTSDVDALVAAGWTATHSGGGLHYCYFGFNCRDVQPEWTEEWCDYHGRQPGFELYPLNISSFRLALSYIIGCERTAWCWDIMQYIVVRNDFPMPPGFGEWRNPYIMEYPEDWALAVDILVENGFTYDVGPDGVLNAFDPEHDSTDDIWYMPNGQVLVGGITSTHPGSDREADGGGGGTKGIYAMSPGAAAVSVEFVKRHCVKWNKFFLGEELEGIAEWYALFHHDIEMNFDNIILTVWYNRNHDIFYLCGSFSSRNPSYLFSTYHSSMDIEGADNDPGIVNEGLDKLLYTVQTFQMIDYELLDYNLGDEDEILIPASTHYTVPQPDDVLDIKIERCHKTGVYYEYLVKDVDYTLTGDDLHILNDITLYPGDALEVNYVEGTYTKLVGYELYRDIVWLADWKLFYLVGQMGNYGRDYWDLFKPCHECWIDALGYGAGAYNLPWTFGSIHECGLLVGGSMKWQCSGDVVTLNPVKTRWVYEVTITQRIYDYMIARDPIIGGEMPWMLLNYEEIPYLFPDGTQGQILRMYIRDDIYWHDGSHVTVKDIKWNYEYIAHVCPDIGTPFPEYTSVWSFFDRAEIINDYVIDVYITTTGHWKVLDFIGTALTFPAIIWEPLLRYDEATAFQPWAWYYTDWTGCLPTGSIPASDLTCLIGTGPFYLNMALGGWDGANLAVLSKNPDYWVRQSAAPSGQVGGLKVVNNYEPLGKKFIEGPTFILELYTFPTGAPPYPGYPKEGILDLTSPICSWWRRVDNNAWAHLASWIDDNGNGIIDASDNIDLKINPYDWPEIENGCPAIVNFHVDAIEYIDETHATMIVSVAWIYPMITKYEDALGLIYTNVLKTPCTFTYRVTVDDGAGGEILVATATVTDLAPLTVYKTYIDITNWASIPACVRTWRLYTQRPAEAETLAYTIEAGFSVGDCAGADPLNPPYHDYYVFWQDLLIVLVGYGAKPTTDPVRWAMFHCSTADFNCDDYIFWQDLLVVLVRYGKKCDP